MYIGAMNGRSGLNISAVNRGIYNRTGQDPEAGTTRRRDHAAISRKAKLQEQINQITEEKQKLIEEKKALRPSGTKEQIEENKLKAALLEEQIQAMDQQIQALQNQILEEDRPKTETGIYKQPRTEEEAEAAEHTQLIKLSAAGDQVKVVADVKASTDRRIRELETQTAMDIKYGIDSLSRRQELSDMRTRSANAYSDLGEALAESHRTAKETAQLQNAPTEQDPHEQGTDPARSKSEDEKK